MKIDHLTRLTFKSCAQRKGILEVKFAPDAEEEVKTLKILVIENGSPTFKRYKAGDFADFNSLAIRILNEDAENFDWYDTMRGWVEKSIPEDTWDDLTTDDVAKIAKSMMGA